MGLRERLARRKSPRLDDKSAVKAENEDAPRTVNGIRAAKALLIIRHG